MGAVKRRVLITLALAIVLVLPGGIWGASVLRGTRIGAPLPDVLLSDPGSLPDYGWHLTQQRSESRTHDADTLKRSWASDVLAISLSEQVLLCDNAISATVAFFRQDPYGAYRDDFGDNAQKVDSVTDLKADNHNVFCGHVNHSVNSHQLERCSFWEYWARYGQIMVRVSLGADGTTAEDFIRYVRILDLTTDEKLGPSTC